MTKIHHATTNHVDRWVFEPDHGAVLRSEMVRQDSGTHTLVHEGKTFTVGKDGAFDLPDDLADFLLRQPGWHRGPSPFGKDSKSAHE